jgi:hypothetical protein
MAWLDGKTTPARHVSVRRRTSGECRLETSACRAVDVAERAAVMAEFVADVVDLLGHVGEIDL